MTIPSVTLLDDGDAFGEAVGDLLGVGFFVLEGVEGFFFFGVGVGVGLVVFEASAASLAIAGNIVARNKKKILREICPINAMVSNQFFRTSRNLVGADGLVLWVGITVVPRNLSGCRACMCMLNHSRG